MYKALIIKLICFYYSIVLVFGYMVRIKRLAKSFTYAFRGLLKVFREEQNLTVHTFAAVIVIAAGLYFNVSRIEWALLLLSIFIVFLMEIVNSAIERVTDILKPRIHEYVKEIKDIMAAAVMLASFFAILIGVLVFLPQILQIFGK